jgi:hypothetical protein
MSRAQTLNVIPFQSFQCLVDPLVRSLDQMKAAQNGMDWPASGQLRYVGKSVYEAGVPTAHHDDRAIGRVDI